MLDFVSSQHILTDPLLGPSKLAPLIDCFRVHYTFKFRANAGERAKERGPFGATYYIERRTGSKAVEQGI